VCQQIVRVEVLVEVALEVEYGVSILRKKLFAMSLSRLGEMKIKNLIKITR